ncbi:MAG TPA: hypothetical protein VF490_10945 [Chryseosolibacter sp.]
MSEWMDLVEETMGHFREGARSVRAYTDDITYIITKGKDDSEFIITTEEPGFPKEKTNSLDAYFVKVFGIEARY